MCTLSTFDDPQESRWQSTPFKAEMRDLYSVGNSEDGHIDVAMESPGKSADSVRSSFNINQGSIKPPTFSDFETPVYGGSQAHSASSIHS
jgi:hypothetical protein